GEGRRSGEKVKWVLGGRVPDGWSYSKLGNGGGMVADNSNTQYALLGLHEAIQSGVPVDRQALEAIRRFYIDTQTAGGTGGWGYRRNTHHTMTMTSAGLCNLLITGMDLHTGKAKLNENTGVAEDAGGYDAS